MKPQKALKTQVNLIEIYEHFQLYSIKKIAHGCQWRLFCAITLTLLPW